MAYRFLAACLAATAMWAQLPPATPESQGMSTSRLKRLDALMEQYVKQGKLAGAVTLVARNGKLVHRKAHGLRDVEKNAPMQADSMFRIASQTKAITSVAAMMLVEEGALRLNDPAGRFIPAFQKTQVISESGPAPARRPITIRDLLTHTAGVSYGVNSLEKTYRDANLHMWYFADKDEPLSAAIDRLAGLPFDAQPGEKWVYGFSSDILGRVVEVASGMALDQFFQKRIFEPLRMNDTYFFVPEGKADRLATVYGLADGRIRRAPEKGRAGQGEYVEGPRKCFSGGAGLVSTAGDYARFLQMLANGGELEGARLLSPASVRAMTVNQTGNLYGDAGMSFGLGFSIVEDIGATGRLASRGEFGWGGAYHTSYWVAPEEGLVALFFTQLLPATGSDVHDKFRALVYQSVVGTPGARPAARAAGGR
ncbi:MAG: beta-lactamase family protein [Bryobacteraceae bacterium]|nr:beta-lactamase family protein [Bryobacteraceae bacterium]